MSWVEVFAVLMVCHLVGDFLLQTEWQATRKQGGLGRDPERRRALFAHVATYAIPFLPAFYWISDEQDAAHAGYAAAGALVTHLIQDDGRALVAYVRVVKKTTTPFGSPLWMAIDQSFHVCFLFGTALAAACL
ncbi:membrane protein [Paraconexibacter sp. AEG42_29]|uniref:Membrane protein n=1 Tax=Paraconexibacter sp. AEG42_29 TaxID=2997339 RepID=A0AAU7AYD8_9ACTN